METASATLEKQQHELQATRHSLDEVRAALAESQAEVQLLKEQQIAADRSAEAAAMAAEGERKAALSQSQSVETRLSEMQLALDSAVAELLPLRRDHQQVQQDCNTAEFSFGLKAKIEVECFKGHLRHVMLCTWFTIIAKF